MAISESQIVFYSGGGHNHNGINSSLLDTSLYSVFDFSLSIFGDPDRERSQVLNAIALKEYIVSTVNTSVLQPAGIFLQSGTINGVTLIDNTVTANQIAANTITANEIAAFTITANEILANTITANQIAANTITANEIEAFTITANEILANTITANQIAAGAITASELAANIVLVNNIISSGNFSSGVSGWAINSNGTAEFDSASIRGGIIAGSVSTPGIDILSDGSISSENFQVDPDGTIWAQNAVLSGEINATSGTVAGWQVSASEISADSGAIRLYQEAEFGALYAGLSAETQIGITSDAIFFANRGGVTTDINAVTDAYYSLRITDDGGGQKFKASPQVASISNGAQYAFISDDGVATNGEVFMNTGYVTGPGIAYPGCTTGPGTFNNMGLVWNNPDIRGTVDNVISAVLGTVSDVRSKTNIVDAPKEWETLSLNNLRVVEFNPVDILDDENLHLYPKRLGLIAQEIKNTFPHLVSSINDDDESAILSVNYTGLVPHLLQMVQSLNLQIIDIKKRLDA